MATLDPRLLLGQQPFKTPDFNIGETFTNIARIKAYQQAQKLEELKYGQAERAMARDDEFQRLAAQLYTQEQPAAQPPQRGLAGDAVPPAPGAAPPAPAVASRGSGVVPMTNMAASVPPAPPGENYTGRSFQTPGSPFAMMHTPPADPGLAGYQSAPVTQQPMAALMGPQGAQLGAVGSPLVPGIPAPPSMEPGVFSNAQGTPAPRGLAAAAPAPTAPQEPPGGLGGAQPGEPKPLLPQMNERVMAQLYAQDPEKAGKLIEGQLSVQSKKLEQTEKMNEQIHQVLSALQASPDPAAMYPEALKALKRRGIPIPDSFPATYDPALMAFKLREHETLKARIEMTRAQLQEQQAAYYKAHTGKELAEGRKIEEQIPFAAQEKQLEIQNKLADLNYKIAQTDDLPKKRELEAERNMLTAIGHELTKTGQQQTAGQQQRTAEQSALGEWNKISTPYREMRDAVGMIEAGGSAKVPGPASDQLIVNGFLRLVDTRTGVRDGERRDFLTAGGLLQALQRGEAYVTGTTTLRPEFKKDILSRTREAYGQAQQDYDKQMTDYRGIAERQNLNPDNVVIDFRTTNTKAQRPGGQAQSQTQTKPPASSQQTAPAQPRVLGQAELQQLAEERSKVLGKPVTVEDVKRDLDPKRFRTQ